ncbi:MAG TPA: hypothetical protein VL068_13245 [Microthrixaceae bacterium]|nr:hypothetical protein [Microthrixaceae bacterium]
MTRPQSATVIRETLDNIRGASEIVAHLVTPWRRSFRTAWGATPAEHLAVLPGDELISNPTWHYTHAITIDADRMSIWAWLVQLGQGRGGFYSFQYLENLAGCHIRNTDRILSDHQQISVGDPVRLQPKASSLRVAIFEPHKHLILASELRDPSSTWSFHLVDSPDGSTRLIERGWYQTGPGAFERLTLGPIFLEPVSFVMSRQMLRTIRIRVEQQSQT